MLEPNQPLSHQGKIDKLREYDSLLRRRTGRSAVARLFHRTPEQLTPEQLEIGLNALRRLVVAHRLAA